MGLLDNFRTRNRSPPSSKERKMGSSGRQDYELDAAIAVSMVENNPPYLTGKTPGDIPYLGDEDAAMAAAIGASLDAHEAQNGTHQGGSTRGPWGSHASQDSAFFTDGPILPVPTAPTAPWGAMIPMLPDVGHSAGRQRRGASPVTAPGVERRRPTDEDEALARRLHAQWISEDTAKDDRWSNAILSRPRQPDIMGGMRICASCGHPILEKTFKNGPRGIYHNSCWQKLSPGLPSCSVCHDSLPVEGGRIHFYRHNYFNNVYCPWHHESTPRCCSCMRLEPMPKRGDSGEGPFAELQDGRMVCMTCAKTAVVDSAEGAPAYQDVCDFLEHELLLMVSREMRDVPVLVVDSPTLNEQTHRETSHGGSKEAGIPSTRGLTLSEVATVTHLARGSLSFNPVLGRFEVGRPTQVNLGEKRAVTAILVLCGLPYASFSSILAHEAMHAVMKLDPSFPTRLPSQVEEGVCQLVAWLWLQCLGGKSASIDGSGWRRQPSDPPSDEDLRGFFAHQIETDVSVVYGDGFRNAKEAYDAVGLEALLGYIKQYQSFPQV